MFFFYNTRYSVSIALQNIKIISRRIHNKKYLNMNRNSINSFSKRYRSIVHLSFTMDTIHILVNEFSVKLCIIMYLQTLPCQQPGCCMKINFIDVKVLDWNWIEHTDSVYIIILCSECVNCSTIQFIVPKSWTKLILMFYVSRCL